MGQRVSALAMFLILLISNVPYKYSMKRVYAILRFARRGLT